MAYHSEASGYSDIAPPDQDGGMGSPPQRGYGQDHYGGNSGYDGGSPAPGYGGGMAGSGPMDEFGHVIGGRRQVLDKRGMPIRDMRKADNIRHLRSMLDQMNYAVTDTAQRFDQHNEDLELREEALAGEARPSGAGAQIPMNPYGDERGPHPPTINMDELPMKTGQVLRKENSGGFMSFRRWEDRVLAFSADGCSLVLAPSFDEMGNELLRIDLSHAHSARLESLGKHSDTRIKNIFSVVDGNGQVAVQLAVQNAGDAEIWEQSINFVTGQMQDGFERWQQAELQRREAMQAFLDGGGDLDGGDGGMGGDEGRGGGYGDGGGTAGGGAPGDPDMDAVATTLALQHVAYGQGISEAMRGVESEFTVEVRDDRGMPDPDSADPEVMVAFLDSDELQLPVPLEYLGNGAFMGQYSPSREGEYELHIKAYQKHIQGSPFLVTVNPAPTAPLHCLVDGAGTRLARVGQVNSFRVTARNQFDELRGVGGDKWELEVQGPGRAIHVEDNEDGTYDVKYEVDLQHEDLSRADAEAIPRLELHVSLIDPRYAHIAIDEQHPYGRPLLGSPFEPVITLDQGGPGSTVWSRRGLTSEQLLELAEAQRTGGPEALEKFIRDSEGMRGGGSSYASQSVHSMAPPTPSHGAPQAPVGTMAQRPPPPPPNQGSQPMGNTVAGSRTSSGTRGDSVDASGVSAADALAAQQDREDAAAMRDEALQAQAKVERDRAALEKEREQLDADREQLAAERKELQVQFERVRQLGRHLEEESTTIAQMAKTLDAQRKALAAAGAQVPGLPDGTHTRLASLQASAEDAATQSLSRSALHRLGGDSPTRGRPATVVDAPRAAQAGGKGASSVYTAADAVAAEAAGEDAERALQSAQGQEGIFDPAVVGLFEKHREAVRGLFEYYSANKGGVSLQQFARMMKDFHVVPTFTKSREVRVAFTAAANLHLGAASGASDEDGEKKRRLHEAAFIEAMSRMAIIALSKPAFQQIYKSAAQKIEVMLEMWEMADPTKLDEIKAKRRAAAAKKAGKS